MCENVNTDAFTDQLTLAGYSIQAAIRYWNNVANWKWLGTTSSTYTTTIGDDSYELPALTRNVHSIRMTGSTPRALEYIGRRPLNKIIPKQDDQNMPYFYDLFRNESNGGMLRLFPIPSIAEDFVVDYYRQMAVPCAQVTAGSVSFVTATRTMSGISTAGLTTGAPVFASNLTPLTSVLGFVGQIISPTSFMVTGGSTVSGVGGSMTIIYLGSGEDAFLDIPADYEDGILAWASHHYLAKRQGSGPKLTYWAAAASDALDKALRANQTDTPDQEICFIPSYMIDSAFLGPNDIRWADIPW